MAASAHRVLLAAHDDDPFAGDLAAVAGELAFDLHGALDVAHAGEGGDGGEQRGIVVRDHGGVEALRVFLGDEAGVEVPEQKRGCCSSAAWKGMLEPMPRMTKPLRASRMRSIASWRSVPCTISLAIIES
jgi:hypothetical protein